MAHFTENDFADQDRPLNLDEENSLRETARRVANKGTFEVAQLHVKQIWDILRENLTQDRRDGRDYKILHHRSRTYNRAPTKEEMWEGAYLGDPWMTRVKIHRMKIVSHPVGCPKWEMKKNILTHGFIDVVYTADGYAFYGVSARGGKEHRDPDPFMASTNIDSLRVDAMPLVDLRRRLNRLIEAKTPA